MKVADLQKRSIHVKEIAQELGFLSCGVAEAAFLEEEAPRLEKWLRNGYHGQMSYMENHFDKRLDPRNLVEGARSVISLAYNYAPKSDLSKNTALKISKYAYGEDYHFVVKSKLKEMVLRINEKIGTLNGRVFVDSAPVLERPWAQRAGLGWVGKHTLLLNKTAGSYFFLAEIISDLELWPDSTVPDYCGTCTRCMDACPTDAIFEPYQLDASKCISYLTIELKDEIPEVFKGKMENWVFGCDICQDVCPWNRFSKPHKEPRFEPGEWKDLTASEWHEMTEETFSRVFKKSAVKRTKFKGFVRNSQFLKKQK
jgi:epoxyqueuosine reductase